jgi:lipoprotein-releasing system permease protein
MKLEHFIAVRYILAGRKNRNISAASITVITVIAVSIIFFIASVSIMNGYIYGIMKIAFEIKSFHLDYPGNVSLGSARETADFFNADNIVKIAFPYLESRALLSANGMNTGITIFRTVPRDLFTTDDGLLDTIRLKEGRLDLSGNGILISQKSANKLRIKPGDSVYVTIMKEGRGSRMIFRKLMVTGLFSTGFVELDEQLAYTSLATGQRIFGSDRGYSVGVKLNDYRAAEDLKLWYETAGYSDLTTWEEANYNELTALRFERNIIAFIVSLIMLVATINILTTIYMTVMEKKQDIGILKALGYSPRHISVIFLFTGIYLGTIGVTVGVISGLMVQRWLNHILQAASFIINWFIHTTWSIVQLAAVTPEPYPVQLFPEDFYLDTIYTEISFRQVLFIAILTFILSILASIAPAVKASLVKPNEVIKNG